MRTLLTMTNYELMTIVKSSLTEQGAKDLSKQVQDLIGTLGGKVVKDDFWGKRKFAYEVKGSTEGYYDVITFTLASDQTTKLEQKLNLINDLVRYLVSARS
jgi:small subunit ribosomal protein S6